MNSDFSLSEGLTELETRILRALRLCGELAPERPDEVAHAESVWDEIQEKDLPESLLDPAALAAEIVEGRLQTPAELEPDASQEIEDQLARAARFGSDIPANVEATMKEDKRRAREKSLKS